MKDFSNTDFFSETTSGQSFRKIKQYLAVWESKGSKNPKKGHFTGSQSIQKTLRSFIWQNLKNQPKMTVSAGKKTFKNLKLENYRYGISLKLAQYVYDLNIFHFYLLKAEDVMRRQQRAPPNKLSKITRNLSKT